MNDEYVIFLNKFGKIYPETYIKLMEMPDEVIDGWINMLKDKKDFVTLKEHKKVNAYFEDLIILRKNHQLFRT
jgi:hypothetical protein